MVSDKGDSNRMKRLFDLGDRYAKESTWKDFASVKLCLFSIGLAVGTLVAESHREAVITIAIAVFAATYIPLMAKAVRIAVKK